ncbi:MAG: sugar ABC transporter ATP-binding protein [Verrucomicrobiales bacterium]|nr:sugar ABC transporter ATP-binding protein [Verrucomicrobiales bacterium]
MSQAEPKVPLLEMSGIRKEFPGVLALDEVDLTLRRGEVLALLGENGAGKSTLIKMLGGAHAPDRGEILVDGESVEIRSAMDAREAGIAVIYQEFNLVPQLSVLENLFLGREQTRWGVVDRKTEVAEAKKWLARIGLDLDPDRLCGELTVAQQQGVEIVKALSAEARILVMDEPSAVLTGGELERLFEVIRELQEQGIGVIYISHRLDEVDELAGRLLVLRDGKLVGERRVDETSRRELIEMMVGRPLEKEFPTRVPHIGEERLKVEGLSREKAVRDVSFAVRSGEIVGFFGLVGAGRTEVMRLIAGADARESGVIQVDGEELAIRNPREAISAGICLLSEDRKSEGLVLKRSVIENFGLPNLRRFSRRGWLDQGKEQEEFSGYREELNLRLSSAEQRVSELSGGNQQKVVLSKWLARHAEVILFDEPTRGIDVGAKFEIYQLIHRLADEGKAIVLVSSELPEILGLSDRIVVMREGRIIGEKENSEAVSQEEILALAIEEETP